MKKQYFAKHAKSSAALISLGIHAVLIVIALSFVAVTVITKEDQVFEAKSVKRPKVPLKKLQVPVNIKKKKTQKPKLRKRIVVQPKLTKIPEIKMPEITGVKGGIGSGVGDGLGGAGSLGFSMPEINIFGIKGKGEKIFIILDASDRILSDAMGGIPAYTIIKNEVIRIVEELPPTALFNICVFHYVAGQAQYTLFPSLVSASNANKRKVEEWLGPLNSAADATRTGKYGIKTLGPGGINKKGRFFTGNFAKWLERERGRAGVSGFEWHNPVMLAMQQQADTVFLLCNTWGDAHMKPNVKAIIKEWKETTPAGKKWIEDAAKGRAMHAAWLAEENAKRKAAGQPPMVISSDEWGIMGRYFPNTKRPPIPGPLYIFTPGDFAEAFVMMYDQHRPKEIQTKSGLNKKKRGKTDFSLNVIQFVKKDGDADAVTKARFSKLTQLCNGEYRTVAGLDEIESYVQIIPER